MVNGRKDIMRYVIRKAFAKTNGAPGKYCDDLIKELDKIIR